MLEKASGSFKIRKFSGEQHRNGISRLDTWDLSVFGRASQHGAGRHPGFSSKEMEEVKCNFLSLSFDTVGAREKFNRHFMLASQLRDTDERKIQDLHQNMRNLSERPQLASSAPTHRTSRHTSWAASNASQDTVRGPARRDSYGLDERQEMIQSPELRSARTFSPYFDSQAMPPEMPDIPFDLMPVGFAELPTSSRGS